jgi:alanyl-tRNA synthetase
VLRRLIRRVVRHGRLVGIDGTFINAVAETAIALSESAYPAVRDRDSVIKAELDREEVQFLKTLDRGEKLLAEILAKQPTQISGEDAFTLYDTYGFPLELTQEIAEEQGLTVDTDGFEVEMEQQRQRARAAHETIDLTVQGSLDKLAEHLHPTQFLGYTDSQASAKLEAILVDGQTVEVAEAGNSVQIVLDQTPFYAESGGQIGDRGYLSTETALIRIDDVKKENTIFVHFGRIDRGTITLGETVTAQIDRACRRRAQANHSATHLLQAALKQIIDDSVSQAGSLVDFDRLRFDFNCPRALTAEEVQQIEDRVNTWIAEAHGAEIAEMAIADAKTKGATAMFGEKYGDVVRVVDFSGVSMELCGGTHVGNTAEIGAFKIISETGISSGVRRIEAVSGPAVLDYLNVRDRVVKDLCDRFKIKPEEVGDRISSLQEELKTAQKDLAAVKGELAVAKSEALVSQAETVGEFKILVANLGEVDAKSLQGAAERLQQKLGDAAVVLGSVPEAGKVSIVAAFAKSVNAKGLQAGQFVGAIAKICGGGGGGRPNLAQAGGREAAKLPEALEVAIGQLRGGLS